MTGRKITALSLALAAVLSLCGCDNSSSAGKQSDTSSTSLSESSQSSSDGSSSENSSEISDISAQTFLRGAAGDIIRVSEITEALNADSESIAPESLNEENFYRVTTNGAYYAKPLYSCLTDRDNEYDADALLFKDAPQGSQSDFIKVKKGDTIMGMTVAEASSDFNPNSPVPGVVVSTNLTLEGEKTLTGYIRVVPDNEYSVSVGDILFIPSGKIDLPVVRFDGCDKDGVITRRTGDVYIMDGTNGSLTYTNEFADKIVLGNISDTTADISDIPTDGSIVKATVTISKLSISSSVDWLTMVNALLVSVDI